jgi:hypothetical protein
MVDVISQQISEHFNKGAQHLHSEQYIEARREFKQVLALYRENVDHPHVRFKARGGLNKANEALSKQH